MRLRLKYPINVRPDPKTGEYSDLVGRRLIACGIAVLETASTETPEKRGRGRPRKVVA